MRVRAFARLTRSAAFLAAIASTVLVPQAVRAQEIDCDRDSDREVRAVRFEGNRALSDDELSARVITTPSTFTHRYFPWFGTARCLPDPEGLTPDVARVRQYYQDNGFYRVKIDTIVTPAGRNRVTVAFKIDEGTPSVVDTLSITGLDSISNRAEILKNLQLQPGERFGRIRLLADVDSIASRLRNSGYPHATVFQGYNAGPNSTRAQVFLTVEPGARARFGTIYVQRTAVERGKEPNIDSAVVLRLLGFRTGHWYSDRALYDATRNLYNLGVYRHAGIEPDTASAPTDTSVDVIVDVNEDHVRQLSLEEGWATLDCFRVDGQYTDKNFANKAWRLDLTSRLSKLGYGSPTSTPLTRGLCQGWLSPDSIGSSKLNYYAGATVRQPTLFGGNWIPAYSLYSERRGEYRVYLRNTFIGTDVSATRNIGDRMPLRLGYSFEYGETKAEPAFLCVLFSACNSAERSDKQRRLPFGVASVSFQQTRTDNIVEPRSGYAFATEARMSQPFLGSDTSQSFYKISGDFALYRPVTSRITFAARVRGGFVTGGRSGASLPPPQERLYAGGANSVRGFQQNELGALIYLLDSRIDTVVVHRRADDTPDSLAFVAQNEAEARRKIPVGGNVLAVFNAELRIRDPFFPDLLEYVPFVDAGQLLSQGGANATNLKRLFVTPGLGFRYFSPVGPIQMNVGYNPSRVPAGQAYFTPRKDRDSNAAPLVCVTGSGAPLVPVGVGRDGTIDRADAATCPASFVPFTTNSFFDRLKFTLSIGTSF